MNPDPLDIAKRFPPYTLTVTPSYVHRGMFWLRMNTAARGAMPISMKLGMN